MSILDNVDKLNSVLAYFTEIILTQYFFGCVLNYVQIRYFVLFGLNHSRNLQKTGFLWRVFVSSEHSVAAHSYVSFVYGSLISRSGRDRDFH